ncbi:hypothetical protein HDV62DRAFT_401852 [Trichoderma sp. SZMC 28011]
MSSSSTDDMFYQDIKAAFDYLVELCLPENIRKDDFAYFPSDEGFLEDIRKLGCWCDRAYRHPRDHDYKSCKIVQKNPYPDLIQPGARLQRCRHRTLKELDHKLFCFKPARIAGNFMDWLWEHSYRLDDCRIVDQTEKLDIWWHLGEYEKVCGFNGTRPLDRNKAYDVLCRLVGLQKQGIPIKARESTITWDVERLMNILGWRERRFERWAGDIGWALNKVAMERVREEERLREEEWLREEQLMEEERLKEEKRLRDNLREKRSRREGDRRGRSLPREQYGYAREEPTRYPTSSRGKSRRGDETQWQDPPDERYYERDEKPRNNPTKEQPRRGKSKSSRPKEQSGGFYDTLLDNLPGGQFMQRQHNFFTGQYEKRRLTDPPTGEFRRQFVTHLAKECGTQAANALGIRQKSPSPAPPGRSSKGQVADPPRRYEGGESSSSRRYEGGGSSPSRRYEGGGPSSSGRYGRR